MATVSDVIEALKKLRDDVGAATDIGGKLQEIIDRIEAGEPATFIVARLLADLVETLADKLGPLGLIIKLYAEVFRGAIDDILGTKYKKYKQIRDFGASHEDVAGLGSDLFGDPTLLEFLRLKYALEKLEAAKKAKPEKTEPAPAEQEEFNDLEPPGVAPAPVPLAPKEKPPWADEDEACCRPLKPAEREPVLHVFGQRIYRLREGRFIDFMFEITHKCGLKAHPKVRLLVAYGNNWTEVAFPPLQSPFKVTVSVSQAQGGSGFRYAIERLQIQASGDRNAMIDVRAISKCFGVLAVQTTI